jgi:hypothetical protein
MLLLLLVVVTLLLMLFLRTLLVVLRLLKAPQALPVKVQSPVKVDGSLPQAMVPLSAV